MPGALITFEGGEGAGKSTQLQVLAERLRALGQTVCLTRQPGGTPHGRRIRELILQSVDDDQLSARAELFLYLADRAQHVDTVIRPALARCEMVLCDRYTDSTLAYQGYGRQLDIAELKLLNDRATGALQPDLVFWLDLSPELGRQRILGRQVLDRLETEALSFHQRVRAGYAALAAESPQRWVCIDAAQAPEQVSAQIWGVVAQRLLR